MKQYAFIGLLVLLSCKSRSDHRIEIPEESHITSESFLTDLEKKVANEPENEHLVRQQLYFCEQLGWPARCEKVLRNAQSRWGMNEKLLDQLTAYYLAHEDFSKVEQLLEGQIETRTRIETRLRIQAMTRKINDQDIQNYLDQNNDLSAELFVIDILTVTQDTMSLMAAYDRLSQKDSVHKSLIGYIPILEQQGNYQKALEVIENQIASGHSSDNLEKRRAINYRNSGQRDTAKFMFMEIDDKWAYEQLADLFFLEKAWDSCIHYTDELIALDQSNLDYVLLKAEALEAKGWVTPSLPYFERVLASDTTNLELQNRVENVRRKVAYLRRKREREAIIPPPVERKTGNN